MFAFTILAAIIVGVGGFMTMMIPDNDAQRVHDARRQLREAGIAFRRGSSEERDALRVLLDGGRPDQI